MRLETLHLKNFRQFTDFRCDFDPRLTVLVANNGGGKTSVLEAICIAFGTYLSAFPTGKGAGIDVSDVHVHITNRDLGRIQRHFPAQISTEIGIQQSATMTNPEEITLPNTRALVSRSLASEKSGTTIKDAKILSEYGKNLILSETIAGKAGIKPQSWPLLAFYGTGRLWRQTKLTSTKLYADAWQERSAGYTDCMAAASSYKFVLGWLEYAARSNVASFSRHLAQNPNLAMRFADYEGPFSPLLKAVQNAVNTVLKPSGWKNLYFSENFQDAILEHDDFGSLPVSQLSDGIRTTVGLIAEIAYRAVQLNPHLGEHAALETDGIVLIDEVDMHLHPQWQQTILPDMLRAFPKVQFIVTTHSPQVLSSIKREQIRLVGKERGEIPFAMTYGEESGNVLQAVMAVDPEPPIAEKTDLDNLDRLVEHGDFASDEARALWQKLEQALGAHHPRLQQMQRSIRRQEALKRISALEKNKGA